MKPTLPAHLLDTVRHVAAGRSNQEIAELMAVSTDGVKSRIIALMKLLGARDRAHIVAVAFQMGILDMRLPPRAGLPVEGVPVELLVQARVGLGWTQGRVAQELGVSTTWLQGRECGRYPFTFGTASRYARLVGVDLVAAA